MDRTQHKPLEATEINESNLIDAVIYGPDAERIGTVSHVHDMGSASQVILDVGGFLGIGARSVALPASQLNFMRDDGGNVHASTTWTKEQIQELPEHQH